MQIHVHVHDDHCLLSVSGIVGTVDVPRLRSRILAALDEHGSDLLVDMRQAGPVSDHLGAALTAAGTRAKDRDRYVVVIDGAQGATSACLRRQRLHVRIPVYRDSAEAMSGLQGSRDAVARRWIGPGPATAVPTAAVVAVPTVAVVAVPTAAVVAVPTAPGGASTGPHSR